MRQQHNKILHKSSQPSVLSLVSTYTVVCLFICLGTGVWGIYIVSRGGADATGVDATGVDITGDIGIGLAMGTELLATCVANTIGVSIIV